ncbi:peroxiredoxin family protein [Halovenus salina]|uniref:Peroxiredoxin family protein n=1 Tax=Halovenus salina TaxID=1510225 RepID=A0ABD5VZ67_9EURY|nr:redoxin domain-containing protein [Halovenus salina]
MAVAPSFKLPNVGPGPDPLSLSALAADNEFVLLLLQRDYHCGNCRKQVQVFADWYDEFHERNTEVVSIVPEPRERVRSWQEEYDLPYPLCADPEAAAGEEYDQPVRFGPLGRFSDLLGRMPKAVLLDCRDGDPTICYTHEGSSTWDRPELEEVFDAIDEQR